MRKVCFQVILSVMCISAQAQKVSNIHAEQRGQDIVVFYTLETTSPCKVNLLLSQDNGAKWSSPLKNVTGDVGKGITLGEKMICWKVLLDQDELISTKVKFKVVASLKEAFDHDLVFVEGGSFEMGSYSGDFD